MVMPPQLAEGLRRRKLKPKRFQTSRPIVETLPRIDIVDLCRWNVFPKDWHKSHYLEALFKYPFVRSLVISLEDIEINHLSDYNQIIPLRWLCPRPLFVCQCSRRVAKLYFNGGGLACPRCLGATYASRACSKRLRPILQAQRIKSFLKLKSYMSRRNGQRIKARIATAPNQDLHSKRLASPVIQLPQRNYSTRGAMHWR